MIGVNLSYIFQISTCQKSLFPSILYIYFFIDCLEKLHYYILGKFELLLFFLLVFLKKWNKHLFVLTATAIYYSNEQEKNANEDDDEEDMIESQEQSQV